MSRSWSGFPPGCQNPRPDQCCWFSTTWPPCASARAARAAGGVRLVLDRPALRALVRGEVATVSTSSGATARLILADLGWAVILAEVYAAMAAAGELPTEATVRRAIDGAVLRAIGGTVEETGLRVLEPPDDDSS